MMLRFILISVIVVVLGANSSAAQVSISDEIVPEFNQLMEAEDFVFEVIPDDNANNIDQQLVNGKLVNPRHFRGVIRMVTGGTCTASIVGPATIFFAAHCLQGRDRITFRLGGQDILGICRHAPSYNPYNNHRDWALCLLQRKVTGITYETVDIVNRPSSGDRLLLTGYGCTDFGSPSDRRLRVGFSTVVEPLNKKLTEPSAVVTRSSVTGGGAILCPGDSGGPLFRTGDDATGARQIVGVNSRTTGHHGLSIFSATSSPEGASFLRGWVTSLNQEICGINLNVGCK